MPIAYEVKDCRTQRIIKRYEVTDESQRNRKRIAARRFADKRDMAYGAICCVVVPVYPAA